MQWSDKVSHLEAASASFCGDEQCAFAHDENNDPK